MDRILEDLSGYLSVDIRSSMLSSRIKESAAGLARDLFPNSISGYGALETTNELATLRSTHKLSSAPSHGTSSSPQLHQAVSKRHYLGNGSVQYSNFASSLDTASDADEELSDFLLQECNIGEASASSSRSDLTLEPSLANVRNTEREHRGHLRRNDSFEPELSRSKQKSPAQTWHVDTDLSQDVSYHDDLTMLSTRGFPPAWSVSMTSEDRHQELSRGYHTKPTAEDGAPARRKETALSRLHLIFSQMPAATQSLSAAESRQTNSFESSYNQLCGGEDAQEWAEFEASLFRTYSGQPQAVEQDIVQRQQQEQITDIITGRQAPLGANLLDNHILQHLQPSNEVPAQQNQEMNTDEEQPKSREPMDEFHCPWIDCHSVSVTG